VRVRQDRYESESLTAQKAPNDPGSDNVSKLVNFIQRRTTFTMAITTANTVEDVARGLEYLSEQKILLCKEHDFGLRNLRRHLLEQDAYSRHARDAIVQRFGRLKIINPEDTTLPTSAVEPFECLRYPRLAVRCDGWQVKPASSQALVRKDWRDIVTNTNGDRMLETVSIGSR
jgi:hypothetical protein